jgi:hypothetical protein
MSHALQLASVFGLASLVAIPVRGASVYNNLTPNSQIAVASRPGTAPSEIEAGDDFFLGSETRITGASFDGLLVPGTGGSPSISQVVVEIYRVFPEDSNVGRTSGPPTFSTPQVPTRVNSPSDVAFDSRDSVGGALSLTSTVLSATFTANNSIQPGGIHPSPAQTTGGNGPVTGEEVQINVNFSTPFDLPGDHYFFVPQVLLSNGGEFYWLSASRTISGAGTTPFPAGVTDLQAWTRDAALDPDWLRVGTDIVGGATPPTFNLAFSLDGTTAVPLPPAVLSGGLTMGASLLMITLRRKPVDPSFSRKKI